MPYELSVAPGWFANIFEYQMSDDIAPPGGVLMMSASPLLDEGGCWTLTKDQLEFERPSVVLAPWTFGTCIWRPKLRVSPGNWIPTANLNREIFTASVTDLPWWTSPSFTWSTSDDSVISLSETSGTQTVAVCDLAAARLRSATLTLRMSVGFDWMEAVFVAGGQSSAPTDGIDRPTITMPTTLFINNDDDNADGQIDRGLGVAPEDDDIVTARLSVAGGREGTLRLTDVFFPFDVFDGTVYEDSVNSQTPVSGNQEWPVSALLGKSVTLRLDAGARSSHSLDSYVMAQFIPNDGTAYSTISRFTIVEPVAEPICNQTTNVIESGDEHCYTINPSGVAVGYDAYFQIDVNPDDYPDTNIVWTAGSPGCVEFTGGGTGRTVRVRGVAPGRTTLTVQIGDCPSSPPSFPFEVVEESRVKVSVWIVQNESGDAARLVSDIPKMLREVNDIYAQVGMSFYLDSVTVTNIPDAYDLHYYSCATNNGVVTNYEWHVDRLVDVARNTGGLEVYFVNSFSDWRGLRGVNCPLGIVISRRGNFATLAHEIGHACGMKDIYVSYDGASLPDELPFRFTHAVDDWNGGSAGTIGSRYYRYRTRLGQIIPRLLMFGLPSAEESILRRDISSGSVYGIDAFSTSGSVSTGLFGCPLTTRNPAHQ